MKTTSILVSLVATATATTTNLWTDSSPTWVKRLESMDFVVQEGKFDFFTLEYCKLHMDTCYAENPVTPYGLLYLPRSPYENPANYTGWGAHGLLKKDDEGNEYSAGWRVSKGESILITGRTPPRSNYWSFAPSLYSRFHPKGWKPSIPISELAEKFVSQCPPGPSRCEVFNSVNDAVNHLTMETGGDGGPFGQPFALLLTWDSLSEDIVIPTLEEESNNLPSVNKLQFPGSILNLGVEVGDEDDFTIVTRVQGIENDNDREDFYSGDWDIKVFRISPPKSLMVPSEKLHPSFEKTMRKRETGIKEHAPGLTHKQLKRAFNLLDRKIRSVHSSLEISSMSLSSFVKDSGYECMNEGTRCQGDDRDAVYSKATFLPGETIANKTHLPRRASSTSELGMDDPNDSFIVAGVLHSKTNKCLYSSIEGYDWPKLADIGGLFETELVGSAAQYLGDHPAAEYLYVAKFARKCGKDEKYCVEVPEKSDDPNKSELAYDSPTVFIERCYVNPATKSAPAIDEIIMGKLYHTRSKPERSYDELKPDVLYSLE